MKINGLSETAGHFFLVRTEKMPRISAEPAQLPTTIGDLADLGQLSGGEDPKPCLDQVRMTGTGRDSPGVTLIR
ncbi:hypothetical protein O4H66_04445 [Comamonadaceae bacterium G21597-S1]|nr:hypothetical protein [Comamonadaceae bacterium G21597-S1]